MGACALTGAGIFATIRAGAAGLAGDGAVTRAAGGFPAAAGLWTFFITGAAFGFPAGEAFTVGAGAGAAMTGGFDVTTGAGTAGLTAAGVPGSAAMFRVMRRRSP